MTGCIFFSKPHLIALLFLVLGASAAPAVMNDAGAQTFRTLYDFCTRAGCADGAMPEAGLVADPAGDLFGTAEAGGGQDEGVVFELVRSGKSKWKEKTVYDFCSLKGCPVGSTPRNPLIIDTSGNLYGVICCSDSGDGSAFELSPGLNGGKWKMKVLIHLCSRTVCVSDPAGGLAYAGQSDGTPYDGSSPLYGTAAGGGAHAQGAVFEIQTDGAKWQGSLVYSFCTLKNCSDGSEPAAGVLVSQSGVLYGTTKSGGQKSSGTAFEIAPGGNGVVETVLHSFCAEKNCTDGANPEDTPVMDAAGNLYGTAASGGKTNDGVLFELAPDGSETVLHDFCSQNGCTDGSHPEAGLVLDPSGDLFGTATGAGANNSGVAFELSSAQTFSVLYAFCSMAGCSDGGFPVGTLLRDGTGNLYGTAALSGANAGGTAFELTP